MKRDAKFVWAGLATFLITCSAWGQGGQGLAIYRHGVDSEAAPAPATGQSERAPADPWGPVPTEFTSVANTVPGLLPYVNNAPVFGLPGTVVGGIGERTQLTGDWGGLRTDLAERGWFFDLYTTGVSQQVTSGGVRTLTAGAANNQLSVNFDTGRAGLWSGGLFHFTLQSRYGSSTQTVFAPGTAAPAYTGFVQPSPLQGNDTFPSEYVFLQTFSPQFSVVLGKISTIFIPDETLFGNSYRYYFANENFVKNPIFNNFYGIVSWAAVGVWVPAKPFVLTFGVLDPNSEADNFAVNAFNRVNLYVAPIVSYEVGGRPGQFTVAFNYTNKPKIDYASPFGQLTPAQVPQALGVLLGSGQTAGLPLKFRDESWLLVGNVSQYLYVADDAEAIKSKLKSSQPLNGVGVLGRWGYAPAGTNPITGDVSAALYARGLIPGRAYDSFGVGYYCNWISDDLKASAARLTGGLAQIKDEQGLEVFYDYAITPAVRLVAGYQHIWNPLAAKGAENRDHADVVLFRMNIAW